MIFHTGLREQRGRGIGALFSGLMRGLKPLAQMGFRAGKRLLNSDFAKNLGKSALEAGKQAATNIAVDLLEGKNISDSAQCYDDARKSRRSLNYFVNIITLCKNSEIVKPLILNIFHFRHHF
jgi:hypothetical protein